ncbi:MAG: histidinol-phosphatase [Balneolaceae bacterium]
MATDLHFLRNAAERIAREAGESTLAHFRSTFQLEYKGDDSPVTNADREAEERIRERIHREFPDHGIIGEEYGSEGQEREVVWVVDPIDGTHSFIHGIPLYTTLVGILIGGVPKVGVIFAPALGELVSAAVGGGTTLNGKRCRVRECTDPSKAVFLTTDVNHIYQYDFGKPFETLVRKTRLHRTWGDAYGHLMVASGRADLMFDPILNLWDAAPLQPVIQEAGGSFTDVSGVSTIQSGNAISCTTGLKEYVLNLFADEKAEAGESDS